MKKVGSILVIVSGLLFLSLYLVYGQVDAELVSDKTKEIHKGNFILHIRVEDVENGFQVLRSIQYMGDKPITLKHQTPLISVSFQNRNHDYTGSTISKTVHKGGSYHPQGPKIFKAPTEGEHALYSQSTFTAGGETITINHKDNLLFK
ncbi:hypothetical protein GCM10008983_16870 [Lentibacillus halophilus]|uniref:Uncharacterized protein n=1 Tax=Lentibacillus halophilus TaxID=295065 RepID=A0ABP3J3P4_9BACI